MEGEQVAAPAAAPRVQVVRHPRLSDSIQPPGGWVNDPADVACAPDAKRLTRTMMQTPVVPAPTAATDLEPPVPTRVEEVATTRNQQPASKASQPSPHWAHCVFEIAK
eukprot:6163972-Prymnesium_polylepis.1